MKQREIKLKLVVNEYTPFERLNYFYIYSPVAKLTMVRLVIAFVCIHKWYLHRLDVNNDFFMVNCKKIFTWWLISYPLNLIMFSNWLNPFTSRKWYEKLNLFLPSIIISKQNLTIPWLLIKWHMHSQFSLYMLMMWS